MVLVNWIKAHRKSIITHGLIIIGFVLIGVFVAEPFFDTFEAIESESKLHEFQLPRQTENVTYSIGEFTSDNISLVTVSGWAFIGGQDSEDSAIYLVLKSAHRTYIFDTMGMVRKDVTQAYKTLNLNLDKSGFMALIPARKLENGEYVMGICVKNNDVQALRYTFCYVDKSNHRVTVYATK